MKLGFVDVGGGTRGIYGCAVLDRSMDEKIAYDCMVGVSAGTANIASYLAGQRGRSLRFYYEYCLRDEYISPAQFFKTGNFVNLDYGYSELSNTGGESPVDYETLAANPADFIVVATDAMTGEPTYFDRRHISKDNYDVLKASSCVPGACKPYPVDDRFYYDGGISDPIPYEKCFAMGCDKVVVTLTRPRDYYRTPGKDRLVAAALAKSYPLLAEKLRHRAEIYNRQLDEIKALEDEGRILIVAPTSIGHLGTLSKDKYALKKLYIKGYADAAAIPEFVRS